MNDGTTTWAFLNNTLPTAEEAAVAMQWVNAALPTAEEFAARLQDLADQDPFFAFLLHLVGTGRGVMALDLVNGIAKTN